MKRESKLLLFSLNAFTRTSTISPINVYGTAHLSISEVELKCNMETLLEGQPEELSKIIFLAMRHNSFLAEFIIYFNSNSKVSSLS